MATHFLSAVIARRTRDLPHTLILCLLSAKTSRQRQIRAVAGRLLSQVILYVSYGQPLCLSLFSSRRERARARKCKRADQQSQGFLAVGFQLLVFGLFGIVTQTHSLSIFCIPSLSIETGDLETLTQMHTPTRIPGYCSPALFIEAVAGCLHTCFSLPSFPYNREMCMHAPTHTLSISLLSCFYGLLCVYLMGQCEMVIGSEWERDEGGSANILGPKSNPGPDITLQGLNH